MVSYPRPLRWIILYKREKALKIRAFSLIFEPQNVQNQTIIIVNYFLLHSAILSLFILT